MKKILYLLFLLVSVVLSAQAQFTAVIEQFPASDYSSKNIVFDLNDVAAQVGTDAATLGEAFDNWVNMYYCGTSVENMIFLVSTDGTLIDDYDDYLPGFYWITTDGNHGVYESNNSTTAGTWYISTYTDTSNNTFCFDVGQYPDVFQPGDEVSAEIALIYEGKRATFNITLSIIERPEIPAPTTLIENELNIVGEKEIIVEQNPRNDYEAETIKINICDAISELGIENQLVLTEFLGEILFFTDGSYSDSGLFIKKEKLSNESTADYPGYWLGAVQNDEGDETGECSRITWGDNNKFCVASFFYTKETYELSCRLGQKPGILMPGEHFSVNLYLIYGDKAYRLIYRLNMLGDITPNTDVITSKDEASTKGFYYNLISKTKEAEVINNPNKYSGEIIVPERVEYNGDVYTVTSIGGSAFAGCSVSNVILPKSIVTIKGSAFSGCQNLKRMIIPNGVTTIGDYAFSDCKGLSSIFLPNSLTSIGSYTFRYCSGLTTLTIPNSVSNVGELTFSDCTALKKVVLSHNLTSLGRAIFWKCESLNEVEIPEGVTDINQTFSDCKSLESIILPNTVITIREAFSGCSKLSSISLSKSLTTIGEDAFNKCISLTSIDIPVSVTSIGNSAFGGCTGLTSVTIPNNVTSIGGGAFAGCKQLKTIIIGENIKVISYNDNPNYAPGYSFANCQELMDVYCYAVNVPITSSNTFDNSYIEYATLHVPAASIEAYKVAIPWSSFKNVVPIDGETPIVEKCATPSITYANGKVKFACETEGVEYVPTLVCTPKQMHDGDELEIGGNFTVSVYAVKEGYENSDKATMTINISQMGDVNADGELNAADITAVVNAILGKQ